MDICAAVEGVIELDRSSNRSKRKLLEVIKRADDLQRSEIVDWLKKRFRIGDDKDNEFLSIMNEDKKLEMYKQFYDATKYEAFECGICGVCGREQLLSEVDVQIVSIPKIPNQHRLHPLHMHTDMILTEDVVGEKGDQ